MRNFTDFAHFIITLKRTTTPMHLGQSLLSIIRNDTIETDFMQEVDLLSLDFEHFLRYTFVAQLTDRRAVPGLDYKISIEADTETFVEQVIGEYISDGLEDDRYFHKIIPESSQPTIEFLVDCIRNPFWQRFCSMVGRERFLKIVSEAKSFTTQSELIYWSFSRSRPDIAHKSERHLSKAGMMYSTAHSRGNLRVLPESLDIVLKRIEFSDRSHVKSIPKRLRRLRGLLKRAQNRDLRLNYYSLHQSVISEERHQRNETVTHAISFVLIVLKKLFSASYLGCSSNKKLFERFLISYLKSPKKTNLSITALLQKLNLLSVSWLGKNSVTSAKHEDLRKRILFTNFIRWICCTVVSKVVKAFWYVTETSGCIPPKGSSVAFISHEEWSKASSTWLKGYTNEYLTKKSPVQQCQPRYKGGVLRLVPKKGDFRPLCIPLRYQHLPSFGRLLRGEIRHSYNFEKFTLGRVRDLIRYQQSKKAIHSFKGHLKCSSVNDVMRAINNFRNELLRKYGLGNVKLHALKFDMKHCYDNLNQAKVIECIKALFSEKSEEILFFKRFFHYNPHNPNYAKCAKLVADRVQLERLRKASDDKKMTLIRGFSGSKTHIGKLHISSVFDIVLDQVLNGSIMIGNEQNTYYRKRGVFQGTPLLATFCDVLYDRLLKDTCSFLGDAPDTLLIRLADDFLLLSAEPLICKKVFEIVSSESFQEFGAHINQEKCRFYMDSHRSQHVKFVGLDISLPSLEASRNMSTPINLPTKALLSLRALLNQLTRHFVTRTLNEPFTSGRVSPNVLELDMKQILDSISRCLEIHAKSVIMLTPCRPVELELFLNNIILMIYEIYQNHCLNDAALLRLTTSFTKKIRMIFD